MADFPTVVPDTPQLGLHDQLGPGTNRLKMPGIGTTPYWDPPNNPIPWARAPAGQVAPRIGAGYLGAMLAYFVGTGPTGIPLTGIVPTVLTREKDRRAVAALQVNFQGRIEAEIPGSLGAGVGQEWFEKCHVFPGQLALGNILQTQIRTLELFNAFRRPREPVTWTTFVNNAGSGVVVTNLPGLPLDINSFGSFVANVQVSTAGPPAISGTLDFTFSAPTSATVSVPLTGNRITIFQFRPQTPIRETLIFKTDVIALDAGNEQRIKLREAPRSNFRFNIRTDDDRSRDAINAILFDWQARVFGVPIWHEAKALDSPMAINDTIIPVDTNDADYRVDALVMIYDDNFNFEALEILSFDAVSITLKTGVSQAFDAVNTQVLPVRTAYTIPALRNARFAIGPSDFAMEFTTLDNIDLSDDTGFSTFQGVGQTIAKPVFDQLNFMKGRTVGEGNRRRVIRLDPETGPPIQISPWGKGKPLFQFGNEAKSQAETWDWRQIFHFLAGNQTSFYIPTGRTDFKPLVDLGAGAGSIDFPNYGFTNFVQSITPRSDIRVLRKDGTQSLHEIVGSSVVSPDVERLSITPGIGAALPVVDVDKIEILTLSRIVDDKVVFEHRRPGESRVDINVIGVPA